MLPVARAKLRGGGLAAGVAAGGGRVLVDAVGAAVGNPHVADVGRVDRDAGRRLVGRVDRPASHEAARDGVLEYFVCLCCIIDDPQRRTVGDDVLGVRVAAVQTEAAGRILAARQAAGGPGVAKDLVASAVDDPDVGAVGGDALGRGIVGHRAGRPGTQEAAAGVVDVHVAVGIDHPGLFDGDRAGRAARRGVGGGERRRAQRCTIGSIVVGNVCRGVVDDMERRAVADSISRDSSDSRPRRRERAARCLWLLPRFERVGTCRLRELRLLNIGRSLIVWVLWN